MKEIKEKIRKLQQELIEEQIEQSYNDQRKSGQLHKDYPAIYVCAFINEVPCGDWVQPHEFGTYWSFLESVKATIHNLEVDNNVIRATRELPEEFSQCHPEVFLYSVWEFARCGLQENDYEGFIEEHEHGNIVGHALYLMRDFAKYTMSTTRFDTCNADPMEYITTH